MKTIKLGDVAKDSVTGFQGTVIGHTRMINNCDRLVIQPKGTKDGKAIDSRSFDAPQVAFVEKGEIVPHEIDRGGVMVECGDTVEDRLKGTSGVVMARTEWLVGCSTVSIQPTELKDGLPVDQQHADERDLKIVARANPKPVPVKTGGPRAEPRRR
jgi:hypothetical protein